MGCEFYKDRLIEAALGLSEGRRPDADLSAHLEQCPSCRAAFAGQQHLLIAIDRGIAASVGAEPSPEFAARVRHRLTEARRPPTRRWVLTWVPAAVGAMAAVVLLTFWLVRRESPGPPRPASVASFVARPTANVPVASVPGAASTPLPARGSSPRSKRPTGPVVAEAGLREVLVPPGQEQAILSFYRAMQSGRVDGSALLAKDEPIAPRELKIAPLELPPLDVNGASTEASKER